MATRTRQATEIVQTEPGELTASAIEELSRTKEGQTVLLIRETREAAKEARAAAGEVAALYREALDFYHKDVFKELVALTGSLAANARSANESLCQANAKLAEGPGGGFVADFVRENPDVVQAIFAPLIAMGAQLAAQKLGMNEGEKAQGEPQAQGALVRQAP